MFLAGGVLGRNVELAEVHFVGLDVGTFRDLEAHVGEDFDALVEDLGDGMNAAQRFGAGTNGQRHVGALGGEARRQRRRIEHRLTRVECRRDLFLDPVDRLAERLALLGRHRSEFGHQLGDAALLAERCNAHGIECREIGCRGDFGQ